MYTCSIGAPTLNEEEIKELLPSLKEGWNVIDNKRIEKAINLKTSRKL